MTRRQPQTEKPPGVIRADEAYTRKEFLGRIGRSALQGSSLTDHIKNGLEVVPLGGLTYILGEDWIAYLKSKKKK